MKNKIKCFNIKYDINDEDCAINKSSKQDIQKQLPHTVYLELTDEIKDIIVDELSNKTGWCINSFNFDFVEKLDENNSATLPI